MKTVYLETWTESEAGWGTRPDGVTLHLTREDYQKYVDEYWEREKKSNPSGATPYEYTRQDNNLRMVMISNELFEELSKNQERHGLRLWQSEFTKNVEEKNIIF